MELQPTGIIKVKANSIAELVIVVGDPNRAFEVAGMMDVCIVLIFYHIHSQGTWGVGWTESRILYLYWKTQGKERFFVELTPCSVI
jgi:hypothetical protein